MEDIYDFWIVSQWKMSLVSSPWGLDWAGVFPQYIKLLKGVLSPPNFFLFALLLVSKVRGPPGKY